LIERDRGALRDLVLHGERSGGIAVEPLRPKMRVGLSADQLGVNPDMVCRGMNAPFQYIANAQFTTDLFCVDGLVPVGECGGARDHAHIVEPRQIGREVLGDPVRETLSIGTIVKTRKRQHDERKRRCNDGLPG